MLVPTHSDDATRMHDRARRATSVYERHAYLVYNLALRIACERGAAERAAERTFVTVLGRPDPDAELVATAVRVAIEEAPAQPRPDGAGDAEASALLRATAALPAPQRAALALGGLCGLDGRGVGGALGIGAEAGETLLAAARAALVERVGGDPDAIASTYAGWLWAPPPEAVWQRVWAKVALDEQPTAGAGEAPTTVQKPKRRRRRALRAPRPSGRLVLFLVLLAGAGAAAYAMAGSSDAPPGAGDAASTPPAAGGGAGTPALAQPSEDGATPEAVGPNPDAGSSQPKAEPLSPEEIDKLRMNELRALRTYEKREADPSASATERAAARRQIARIQRIANQRVRAAQARERAARRQLEAERRARARERAAEARREARERHEERVRERRREREPQPEDGAAKPAAPPPPPEDEESGCLYNPDDGSYICPVE